MGVLQPRSQRGCLKRLRSHRQFSDIFYHSQQLATSKYFLNSQQCDTILALKLKYGVKQTSVAKNAVNYFDIVYVKITKTKNISRQRYMSIS